MAGDLISASAKPHSGIIWWIIQNVATGTNNPTSKSNANLIVHKQHHRVTLLLLLLLFTIIIIIYGLLFTDYIAEWIDKYLITQIVRNSTIIHIFIFWFIGGLQPRQPHRGTSGFETRQKAHKTHRTEKQACCWGRLSPAFPAGTNTYSGRFKDNTRFGWLTSKFLLHKCVTFSWGL